MTTKQLEEKLTYKKKSAWKDDRKEIMDYAEGYKAFLGENKTERECVEWAIKTAEQNGFKNIEQVKTVKPGDRIYRQHHNKCVVLFVVGKDDISEGMNLCASHIDSPRLDLKQVPLYEDTNQAVLKTHYYGGIKKYQWTTLPLAMHGVIFDNEGKKHSFALGENPDEPVFFISELLIHLSGDQMAKPASKAVAAEQLNIIVGHIPLDDEEAKESVKLNTLRILNEQYGITEEDFLSAEIEFVPVEKPRDVGFDRGMVAAYGHDDRVCAYPAFTALMEMKDPKRTTVCVLADKEEIGSVGSTGLNSRFFENAVNDLTHLIDKQDGAYLARKAMENSYVLSMDVNACLDGNYPDAFEKRNAAIAGYGTVLTKYTGHGGKSGSNDANSEYMHKLVKLFNENGIIFQTGEIGKVDLGGGGTVALYLASYGANVVDMGVGVLSMHSPYELISKADLFSTYKAAKVFYSIED
ncbi:MAG: aminopeptidase [Eubacteriaceae bacterium]|nr:aminopeptidase [Eubacteriaceae bacterium]